MAGAGSREEEEEEEGSAAQTVRRQQTPANSSGHTMANTGGEPRPPSAQPIASDSGSCQEASEPAWPATGTVTGGTVAFTPHLGLFFCSPHPLFAPMIWSGEDKSKAWFAQLGGSGAFLALNLPCTVNLSPSGATAAIFSCVFLLFLSFFFKFSFQSGFPRKGIGIMPQPWLGVQARFVPPRPALGPGNSGRLFQERHRGSVCHGGGGDGPGSRPGSQRQTLTLPKTKNQSPQGATAPGPAKGIPCPDPSARGQGPSPLPGVGSPLLPPQRHFHPESPSRTGFSHATSACPRCSQ